MSYQVAYVVYNPGQYPDDVQHDLDAMTADGWRIHTALPAYTELYILWERDVPDDTPAGSHRKHADQEQPQHPAPARSRAGVRA